MYSDLLDQCLTNIICPTETDVKQEFYFARIVDAAKECELPNTNVRESSLFKPIGLKPFQLLHSALHCSALQLYDAPQNCLCSVMKFHLKAVSSESVV